MEKLVSVVMSVYNENIEFLDKAITSILDQDYSNLEFIIVNDYSNKEVSDFLMKISDSDSRVNIICNEKNIGLTRSLNKAIRDSRGEFIARMDSDDYSLSKRLSQQVTYLEKNKSVDIVGTGVLGFGSEMAFQSPIDSIGSEDVKASLFFTSTLCHPSVMIRRSFIEKHQLSYDSHFIKTQDYDLWERASIVGNLRVINEVLLLYRKHSDQISSRFKSDQLSYTDQIMLRRLGRIGLNVCEQDLLAHYALKGVGICEINTTIEWCEKLIYANSIETLVSFGVFDKFMRKRLTFAKLRYLKSGGNPKELQIEGVDMLNLVSILKDRFKLVIRLQYYKWKLRRELKILEGR